MISIFNELCILLSFVAAVIIAYYDWKNIYDNTQKRYNLGKCIMFASTGIMYGSSALVKYILFVNITFNLKE